MALLAVTAGLGSLAEISQGSPDEPHAPIEIVGDTELVTNACACIRNPGASGTQTDPFVIEDWRIQATTDPAILVKNIKDNHFVIRDNLLEGDFGVRLVNTGDRGTIVENTVNFGTTGVILKDSSTYVADNDIQGVHTPWPEASLAVKIDGGSPHLDANYISQADTGVIAKSSSPKLTSNEITDMEDGVHVLASSDARLEDNTLRLIERWGIQVSDSANARVISNEIREGHGGIVVDNAKLYMQGNDVTNQRFDAVRFEKAVVQMFRNNITNNWRGAFGSHDSDVVIRNNTFQDNGDGPGKNDNAGLHLQGSEGRVVNNDIHGNDVGIALQDSTIRLEDNNLVGNRWGMDVPHSSKGSIPLMSGNTINGINVDGTDDPSEQRIFFEEVNVTLEDQTIDSGHSNDLFGTLFKQGAVVVYDSQDVTIENITFRYNDVGVHIQDSSFVRIRANTFISNEKAVVSIDSRTFIKDNVCEIEIDPPETRCFVGDGGFVTVRANVAAHVDIGVLFTASTRGVIADNEIRSTTKAGLKLHGTFSQSEHDVLVEDNRLEANVVGAILINFRGRLEANVIANSTWAAAHLDTRTNATFVENRIILNAKGIVDTGDCNDGYRTPCSTGVFVSNVFKANAGVAVHLENGGSFHGDLFVDNRFGADVEGHTRMTGVNATANAKVGIRARGQLHIQESNASANGKHGIRVIGHLDTRDVNTSFNTKDGIRVTGHADLDATIARNNSDDGAQIEGHARVGSGNFSGNAEAGLRLGGTVFVVEDCEASFNTHGVIMVQGTATIDGDIRLPPVPDLPDVPDVDPDLGDDDDDQDPLFMHDCDLVANSDFALKATQETFVNATNNFWGKEGPKLNLPLIKGDNVISRHAIVSPYWETRAHEDPALLPGAEGGGEDLVT